MLFCVFACVFIFGCWSIINHRVLIADSSLVNYHSVTGGFASLVVEGFNPVGGTDLPFLLGVGTAKTG